MTTYIKWTNTATGIPSAPANTPYWWQRQNGGSCEEDRQVFEGQTLTQKLANSSSSQPANIQGRNCGGGGNTGNFSIPDGDGGAPIEGGNDGQGQTNDSLNP